MPEKKVVLASNHPQIQTAFRNAAEADRDLLLVREVEHGRDLLRAVRDVHPDMLVLDLGVPELEPKHLIELFRIEALEFEVVVLLVDGDAESAVGLLSSGLMGYSLENRSADTLVAAIQDLVARDPAGSAGEETQGSTRGSNGLDWIGGWGYEIGAESLTQRELEVLTLVGRGADNSDIARELCISKRTVETHISNIYGKIGLRGRAQAILYAVDQGLVGI